MITKVLKFSDRKLTVYLEKKNEVWEANTYFCKRGILIRLYYYIIGRGNPTSRLYQQLFQYLQEFANEIGIVKYILSTQNEKIAKWLLYYSRFPLEWDELISDENAKGAMAIKWFHPKEIE